MAPPAQVECADHAHSGLEAQYQAISAEVVSVVSRRQPSLLPVGSGRLLAVEDNLRDYCAPMLYEAQPVTFDCVVLGA